MSELKPDEVRQLLRECVTVVQAGEVLVLRFQRLNMQQAHEVREHVRAFNADSGTDLKVLIVAEAELGIAPADGVMSDGEFERRMRMWARRDPDLFRSETERIERQRGTRMIGR